jgi:hypothetical protein
VGRSDLINRSAPGHYPLDVQGSRTGVALALDALSESLSALAQYPSPLRGQALQLLWFLFGEDDLIQVTNRAGRSNSPSHTHEPRLVERDETVR